MEEIKAPKKERRFLKAIGNIGKVLAEELVMGIARKFIGKAIDKVGNKKQGLVIAFIVIASSFVFAQFPSTNNKQRLGFQTTADGLVWRGSISDTASIQPVSNQNAWVILDTVNLKIYSFDFTSNVWGLVGGGSAAFTQPVDSLFFNVNVPTDNVDTAKMRWDSDLATVVLGLNDNVANELGFKNFWLVKNQTGATITKGSIVYANGTVGASGRVTVAKFIANGTIDAKYLLGITAHDLSNGEDGYVISFGKIRKVNTDTFSAGAILYPSPTVAGVWTDVEPIAPNLDMPIGFCINSHANNGTIAIRVASGYSLNELHDVQIISPVDRASLYYRGGLWRDTTTALLASDTASMLTPYFRDADTSLLNLTNRFNAKLNISDTSVFVRDNQISGTSGQVTYFNSASSITSDAGLIYSATNKTLGINTTTTSGANLIIKNSQEPVRSTFLTQQTFAADTTNWTRGAGWTFNGTLAVATAATGDLIYTTLPDTIISGRAYEITYTQSGYSAGTATIRLGNASLAIPQYNITGNIILLLPTSATGGFRITTSTYTGNLDNITINEITGSAPVIFAGQDDGASTLYNSLRMPNSTTLAFGGGGARTTGVSNNFIGALAGLNNSIGSNNNFFGNSAGQNNTTGFSNNFIGDRAGLNNSIGSNNNFFGTQAGQNSIGSNNNFFGNQAGILNTTGNSNNFIGDRVGQSNTTGSNNNFIGASAGSNNTTGGSNNFIGASAGGNNTTGSSNNFIGDRAGQSNTTGTENTFIGILSGANNRTGRFNSFIGDNSGSINRTGSDNVAIGRRAMNNTTLADTLSGDNNTVIGSSAATNIAGAATGNLVIGNSVNLPTNNGSNQVVIKNLIFGTGASGTGTTIAAGSRVGIKTNAPNRDFEVAGEVRITDLTTDAPTRLVGADADGDLGQVTLGAGLSLTSSNLLADTNLLVTMFDTSSMLTNYLRSGIAASTYLPLTGGTLTGALNGTRLNLNSGIDVSGDFSTSYHTNVSALFRGYQVLIAPNNDYGQTRIHFPNRPVTEGFSEFGSGIRHKWAGGDARNSFLSLYTSNNANLQIDALSIDALGNVGIMDTTPSYTLDVNGTLGVTGATTLTGGINGNTTFNNGNVNIGIITSSGISTSSPKLITMDETFGNNTVGTNFKLKLFQDNATSTYGFGISSGLFEIVSGNTGAIAFFTNGANERMRILSGGDVGIGTSSPNAKLDVRGSVIINEDSGDFDTRIESDGNANMVFVDASTDRVGIGYASPTKTLDVNGTFGVSGESNFSNKIILNDSSRFEGNVLFKKNMGLPIVKISNADYTATTANHTIIYTTLTSDKTLTIPNAADAVGIKYTISIFDEPEGNEALSLVTPSSNLFVRTDGENSSVDIVGGFCTVIQSDGIKWYILSYAPMY
jgi:hypothetical protein